jgi:hypothetical protein
MNDTHSWVNNQGFVITLITIPDHINDEGMIPITAGPEPNQPAPIAVLGVCEQDIGSLEFAASH